MYRRLAERPIQEALVDTPAVLIIGPRRAGKTTTVRRIGGQDRQYLTLDDQTTLEAARTDPVGFVRSLDRATIDEVQRVPELLLAIKRSIDDDYRPGRFLLTGSANVLLLPRVADSLAGRMETIRMLPLSQAEIRGRQPSFLEALFAGSFERSAAPVVGDDLIRLVLAGGFPEALARESERRRQDWAHAYLGAVLSRDLRDIADIEKLTEIPRFVRLLAQVAGQLANFSELGRGLGVTHKTSQRYIGLLERIFLVTLLPPWHPNALKRLVKTPKLHFVDTGLLAASLGLTFAHAQRNRRGLGPVLENFVYAEIMKLLEASRIRAIPHHFRHHQGREVDLLLEASDGSIVGIEVKASATVTASDFSGLRLLAAAYGERFVQGVVLYDSDEIVPFGDRLVALPISSLWS